MLVAIGDLIRDNHGREGVVVQEEPFPGREWQEVQTDVRVAALGAAERWLGVLPMSGGYVIAPASLCQRIRRANRDDVLRVVESANDHAVKCLISVFPELVREILGG